MFNYAGAGGGMGGLEGSIRAHTLRTNTVLSFVQGPPFELQWNIKGTPSAGGRKPNLRLSVLKGPPKTVAFLCSL